MGQLTREQRLFCRGVVNGLTPRAAYIKAFDCKESAASAAASRLMKRVNITEEINRLRKLAREVDKVRVDVAREEGRDVRAVWSKLERQEKLQRWAEELMEAGRPTEAIRCVDLLNKMDGAYVVEQEESGADAGMSALRRHVLDATSGQRMVKGE